MLVGSWYSSTDFHWKWGWKHCLASRRLQKFDEGTVSHGRQVKPFTTHASKRSCFTFCFIFCFILELFVFHLFSSVSYRDETEQLLSSTQISDEILALDRWKRYFVVSEDLAEMSVANCWSIFWCCIFSLGGCRFVLIFTSTASEVILTFTTLLFSGFNLAVMFSRFSSLTDISGCELRSYFFHFWELLYYGRTS